MVIRPLCANRVTKYQWSLRKTRTVLKLARQAEIGVWVQAPGTLA